MTKKHSAWMIAAVLLSSAGSALAHTPPSTPQHVPPQRREAVHDNNLT